MLAYKDSLTKRQRLELLRSQLENERSSFLSHWRDLSDYILPRRAQFQVTDANRGDKRNNKIIDNTATLAARTLASGMMSGVTSPARPWFRLTTPDPELAEYAPVKEWLHIVESRMSTSFNKSNLYNTLPIAYKDNGVFGTSPLIIEEDFSGDIFRTQCFPVGSYMIAKDARGVVNVFVREFRMTVRQLLEQFGKRDPMTGKPMWDNFSTHVKDLYDNGHMEAWIDVVHAIYPNEDYVPNSGSNKQKKFSSCYYERGTSGSGSHISSQDNTFLRESGYDYFPVLCPRWEVTGPDVYGTNCPGMEALGDIKQLQLGEKRVMQAVDKMINPPMVGPSILRTQKASILPGDITFVDVREGTGGFRPAHEVNFRIQEMEQKQAQVRDRVRRAFFEDLFLMLANTDRRQITAREIEERHEEKLLALGPVLEQLNQDLLDPLIDITFDIHMKQGLIPPPPEELQGEDLKVEYISIMAQAQKLISIGAVERFTGFVGNMAGVVPTVLEKINTDQLVDVMADILSVPPSIVKSDEEVAKIREVQARAAQAQQQAMMMQQGAATAKDLSQIPMDEDNALTGLLEQANAGSLMP
jgi:hypothetical protein